MNTYQDLHENYTKYDTAGSVLLIAPEMKMKCHSPRLISKGKPWKGEGLLN